MKKIDNLIHGTMLFCVVLLVLFASIEEYVIPVVATLCGLFVLSCMLLVFLVRVRKKILVSRAIERMEMAAKEKVFEFYKREEIA